MRWSRLVLAVTVGTGCVASLEPSPGEDDEGHDRGPTGTAADQRCDGVGACTGAPRWARRFGASEHVYPSVAGMATDGTILIGGGFGGSLDLDATQLSDPGFFLSWFDRGGGVTRAVSQGATPGGIEIARTPTGGWVSQGLEAGRIVVVETDAMGAIATTRGFGQGIVGEPGAIAVDAASGDVVLTGHILVGDVDFGGGLLSPGAGTCGNYLARLSATGGHRASRLFDGVDTGWGMDVAIAPNGDAVIAGTVTGPLTIDGIELPVAAGGGADQDWLVARFDRFGRARWARRFGDASGQFVGVISGGIELTSRGEVVVAGSFTGTVELDGRTHVNDGPDGTLLLARFAEDGTSVWSRSYPAGGAYHLALDARDDLFVGGAAERMQDLGCGSMPASSMLNAWVAKLDHQGTCRWARTFAGDGIGWTAGLAPLPDGGLVMSAAVDGVVDPGLGPLPGEGGLDLVVARYAP